MGVERDQKRAPVISYESESATMVDIELGVLQALAAYCNY